MPELPEVETTRRGIEPHLRGRRILEFRGHEARLRWPVARTLPAELRVLILHGMLHLAGYDHETDRGEMNRIERRLRRRLGLG